MNRRQLVVSAASAALVGPGLASPALAQGRGTRMPTPPVAKKDPVRIEQLGRVRVDEYAWMKDENWQRVMRDPTVLRADIRRHLEAENAYFEAILKSTEPLQATMFEEMKGRIKEDDSSVPMPDGPWEYYTRFEKGAQHPLQVRRPRGGGAEQVLLDEDAEAQGKAYYAVAAASATPDHKLFVWAEDDQGSEYYTIKVKDLATGALLGTNVETSTGGFTFSPDSEWLFWTFRDENGRPTKIYRRPVRGGEDVLVYEEQDPGMFIGVSRTLSDKWIVIGAGNQETSEARLIPGEQPTAAPVVFAPRETGVRYELDHWNDRFVVRTNADGAIDFKLMTAPETARSRAEWRDWIPAKPGRLIEGVAAFKGWLVRQEREDANTRIVVTRAGSLEEHAIAVDEDAYVLGLNGWGEYDTDVVRYTYQSPTTPQQTFDYDMAERTRVLRKTREVPSGHDASKYEVKRVQAEAPDGELVPVTILKLKSTPVDGSAPVMLYGYGSYGIPLNSAFSTNKLSLVDRGWIWADAHVRGGSDKGWGWFQDGRKFDKKNTFTDFVAAADHLVGTRHAAKGRIVAYGGSAGGLLVGAVTNMRPELWAGVIGAVPFVDVINTMSDVSLPLTPPEWPEWGNPIEDPEAYDYMYSYSPYDQVEAKAYPPVFAHGGLSDPRVTYWEPAKWIARLRDRSTSGAPMLLKINMEAGHGGSSGRWDRLKEVARDYAFAIWAVEKGWTKG
jgi:oligopeptidase B